MAITFEWAGYNSVDEEWNFNVLSTNVFGFYGGQAGQAGTPIQVGQYNSSMHIRTGVADDTDGCNHPHLTALQWASDTTVSINGDTAVSLNGGVETTDCIRVKVSSDTNITILASRLYAYNSTNVETAPANLTFKSFYHGTGGDTAWTWKSCGGRTNALSCGARDVAGTEHLYYVGMSISPTSTGASTLFVVRFEADIQ